MEEDEQKQLEQEKLKSMKYRMYENEVKMQKLKNMGRQRIHFCDPL